MLLTTEEPLNNKSIAWVAPHDKTHVCYIQLGHDSKAYATKEFQKLTAQAIAWAAAK
jgi:type 1 glutamine amidotransferase